MQEARRRVIAHGELNSAEVFNLVGVRLHLDPILPHGVGPALEELLRPKGCRVEVQNRKS
jgi:hypothetical protein